MKTQFFSHLVLTLLLAGLIVVACGPATPTAPPPDPTTRLSSPKSSPPALLPVQPSPAGGRCGDGMCDGPESAQNCPQDCAAPTAPTALSLARHRAYDRCIS